MKSCALRPFTCCGVDTPSSAQPDQPLFAAGATPSPWRCAGAPAPPAQISLAAANSSVVGAAQGRPLLTLGATLRASPPGPRPSALPSGGPRPLLGWPSATLRPRTEPRLRHSGSGLRPPFFFGYARPRFKAVTSPDGSEVRASVREAPSLCSYATRTAARPLRRATRAARPFHVACSALSPSHSLGLQKKSPRPTRGSVIARLSLAIFFRTLRRSFDAESWRNEK